MNRPLCLVKRFVLGSAVAALVGCTVVLVCALPVQADVDLAYFKAEGRDDDVLITWGTGNELTTYGFELLRGEAESCGETVVIHSEDAENFGQFIGWNYSYVDSEVALGVTYCYWLQVLDTGRGELHGPERAAPGPPPTSTPTATPTSTPTRVPTATPTAVPTATYTTVPTATPSFTATGGSTSTPAGTPTMTPVSPPLSSPSPTSVVEQRLSPTATPGGMAQPTMTPSAVYGEWTPMPAATTVAGDAETSTATPVAWGGDSEPGATGWSSSRLHWPTIHPSTILLLISLMSLLAALLLSMALALVRKLSL